MAKKAARIARDKGQISGIMTGAGIAVDKMRLLREQATTLSGSTLSPEDKDRRIKEIQQLAADRRALAQRHDKSTADPSAVEPASPPATSPAVDLDTLLAEVNPPSQPVDRSTTAHPYAGEPGGGP